MVSQKHFDKVVAEFEKEISLLTKTEKKRDLSSNIINVLIYKNLLLN